MSLPTGHWQAPLQARGLAGHHHAVRANLALAVGPMWHCSGAAQSRLHVAPVLRGAVTNRDNTAVARASSQGAGGVTCGGWALPSPPPSPLCPLRAPPPPLAPRPTTVFRHNPVTCHVEVTCGGWGAGGDSGGGGVVGGRGGHPWRLGPFPPRASECDNGTSQVLACPTGGHHG